MKSIYKILILGIVCLLSTSAFSQFEITPDSTNTIVASKTGTAFDCTCYYPHDVDRFASILNQIAAEKRDAWLRERESLLKEEIDRRMGKTYPSYTESQKAFFKEHSFNWENRELLRLTKATYDRNLKTDEKEIAKIGYEKSTLEYRKQVSDIMAPITFGQLKSGNTLIKDMTNDNTINARIATITNQGNTSIQNARSNGKIANGIEKIKAEGQLLDEIVNEAMLYYNSLNIHDKVLTMQKYLIAQYQNDTANALYLMASPGIFNPLNYETHFRNWIVARANAIGKPPKVGYPNHPLAENVPRYAVSQISDKAFLYVYNKKRLNEETGKYLKGRNYDNHSFGMMRRLIESYVDNQRFQMNSSELQSSSPAQINPPEANFAMRWHASGSLSSFHPFWGVGNVMSQLYDNSPDSWAREGYSIRQMFLANSITVPSSVYDAQLGQIFDFHSDGWGLKPASRSEVLIYFTGNVGEQLGFERYTFPSFLQDPIAVDAGVAYANGQPFDIRFMKTVNSLVEKLSLDSAQKEWLIKNRTETLNLDDHLDGSQQSIDEARLYVITRHRATPWRNATGTINNNSYFKYNATRTHIYGDGQTVQEFRLDNGDFLARGDYADCAYCSSSSQRTMYRRNGEIYWFDVVVPSGISSDAHPLDFIFDKFWDGAKFVGRYIVPFEDMIIMIGGRDFDGISVNQYMAGGMMVVGFIPGGKLVKPITKVIKGTRVWRVVSRAGVQVARAVYTRFDNVVADGVIDKIDDLFRSGGVSVDGLEETAEKVIDISEKKGRKLTWEEIKALFKRGNDFNKKSVREQWYRYNEVHLENGKRLDSYTLNSGGEIVSRKATDLSNIKFATFENYLKEMINKYPPGTKIRTNKYSDIDGKLLQGKQILEIPDINRNFFDIQRYIDFARDNYNIIIRFRPE